MTSSSEDDAHCWPPTLRRPPETVKLVYLDLNHWISLAKAYTGHEDGERYKEVLAASVDAVDRGVAIFPISDSTYFEISKIRRHRQRRHLRLTIERLSRYLVVTSRSMISKHEFESLLDRIVCKNPSPINRMSYLDWGVARALGLHGGFRVKNREGEDVTDEVRSRHPDGPEAFDRRLADAELELNRKMVEGPSSKEEPELRKLGWNPDGASKIHARRVEQEIELARRLDEEPRWRRGRLRDVVSAHELIVELNGHLTKGLSDRGRTLEGLFTRPEEARHAFDSMPSFYVAVTLKTECHRNPGHRWTPNDIHDIDALGSTIPYCDIVVTDKAAAAHVNRTGLADRLKTVVLARLGDLGGHL